jgi:PhnB protein
MSISTEYKGSGIFLTFSGDCRQAFMLYHTCFGGELVIDAYTQNIEGYSVQPVIRAVLHSPKLVIQGSDLVYNEGRRVGNYMAVLIACNSCEERTRYIEQLYDFNHSKDLISSTEPLVEIVDRFDVRWMFAI